MNFIEKLVNSIAHRMTPPPAYGTFHIILIVVGLSLCFFLAWICRKFDGKKNRILLLAVSGVLILSEILKQFFLYYVVEGKAYCWGELPFQMCSLPMYLCPLAVFVKNERISRAAYGFMLCFNLLGGFAAVFEPSGVFHSYVFLTVHSIFWHYSLVFLGLYIMFSRRAGSGKQDYFDVVKLFVLCCFIAFLINTLVGITVGDNINMFFVGPNNSPLIVFKTIAEKFGWVASTVIYIPVCALGAGLICLINGKVVAKRK